YSPTPDNRDKFGREMAATYNIEVVVCDRPEDVYKGADIVAGLTDSAVPVIDGTRIESGTHIVNIGGTGKPDAESLRRVDVYLRFGDAPAPVGKPELGIDDEFLGWEARPDQPKYGDGRRGRRGHGNSLPGPGVPVSRPAHRVHGNALPDRRVTLADLATGAVQGRTSRDQITYSERGNLQRVQFFAVAGKIYELAKRAGLGREIPTEWLLQDIRD